MHPFRFGALTGATRDRSQWLDQVRAAEDLGYSTLFMSDHFSDKLAPLPALAMAAEHTSMHLGTLVLANDFRHPAVLAKEAATVDLLSEGRLELGIGTGWEEGDYLASGIHREEPAVRVDRLVEAVQVLRGLWSPERLDFEGEHYEVHLDGLPKPGPGRPRLIVGGGKRRMVETAARYADVVGLSMGGILRRADMGDAMAAAVDLTDRRLDWARQVAGDRFERLEFNVLLFGIEVGDRAAGAERLAQQWGITPESVLASPHFLVGQVDEMVEVLQQRRQRWRISYLTAPEKSWSAFAPVVARLTGS